MMRRTNAASAANGRLGGRPKGAHGKGGLPKAPQKVSKLNAKLDVLEFFAGIYQNKKYDIDTRIKAAQAFAPYRYPRLQATHTTTGTPGASHADWVKGITKAIRDSDEPELKLIEGEATTLEDAPKLPTLKSNGAST